VCTADELFAVVEGSRLHLIVLGGNQGVDHSLGDGGGFSTIHVADQSVTTLAIHPRHQPGAFGVGVDAGHFQPRIHDPSATTAGRLSLFT